MIPGDVLLSLVSFSQLVLDSQQSAACWMRQKCLIIPVAPPPAVRLGSAGARTVVFEVPHAQRFISGGRDQHQAAVGSKGQIPYDVSVIHQIQQQCSWNSNMGVNVKAARSQAPRQRPCLGPDKTSVSPLAPHTPAARCPLIVGHFDQQQTDFPVREVKVLPARR